MLFRLLIRLCRPVLLPVAWTLLIIVLLCLPGQDIPSQGPLFSLPNLDKLVHAGLFGALNLFWFLYLLPRLSGRQKKQRVLILIAFLSILMGIVMEWVQLEFIPSRDFDVMDMLADAAGVLVTGGYLFDRLKRGII